MLLFEPLNVGGLTLPNRVILTAMVTRLSGEDGYVNQPIIDRYVRFAQGEPGSSWSRLLQYTRRRADRYCGCRTTASWTAIASLSGGYTMPVPGRVALQIIHFLKIARSGWRQTINDLRTDDIAAIIDAYGAAACDA